MQVKRHYRNWEREAQLQKACPIWGPKEPFPRRSGGFHKKILIGWGKGGTVMGVALCVGDAGGIEETSLAGGGEARVWAR